MGSLNINEWNGSLVTTDFDPSKTTIKTITNLNISNYIILLTGNRYNYTGMVNKDNQPHGWGRAIEKDNLHFIDGQFKDGVRHGYSR